MTSVVKDELFERVEEPKDCHCGHSANAKLPPIFDTMYLTFYEFHRYSGSLDSLGQHLYMPYV